MPVMLLLIQFCIALGVILTLAMAFAFVDATIDFREVGRSRKQFAVSGAYLLALLVSVMLWWHVLTPSWPLSFWSTLRASVDSATFGHSIEHAAENILVIVELLSVICAITAAIAVAIASLFSSRLKHA